MTDAAYFLGGSLTVDARRANEEAAHSRVPRRARGARRAGLRLGGLLGGLPARVLPRDPDGGRAGDDRRAHRARRPDVHDHARPLCTAGDRPRRRRPASGARHRAARAARPAPADEGPARARPEPLWNESWYFDAVSDDQRIGVYIAPRAVPEPRGLVVDGVRLRAGPAVGRPDRLRGPAARGRATSSVKTERVRARPLVRARRSSATGCTLDGDRRGATTTRRASFAASAEIRPRSRSTSSGRPPAARTPTASRRVTRSPAGCPAPCASATRRCRCAARGQRDHSWGTRDWWSAEWVWSRRASGRRHAFPRRASSACPDAPPLGVGYVQPPGEELVGARPRSSASEEVGANGLIVAAQLALGEDLSLEVKPLGCGPLRLESPDGRVDACSRARCAGWLPATAAAASAGWSGTATGRPLGNGAGGPYHAPRARIAQWIERWPPEPEVAGSNPAARVASAWNAARP